MNKQQSFVMLKIKVWEPPKAFAQKLKPELARNLKNWSPFELYKFFCSPSLRPFELLQKKFIST